MESLNTIKSTNLIPLSVEVEIDNIKFFEQDVVNVRSNKVLPQAKLLDNDVFIFKICEFKFKTVENDISYKLKGFYYTGLIKLINHLGFYKRYLDKSKKGNSILIYEKNNVIEETNCEVIRLAVLNYIESRLIDNPKFEFEGEICMIPSEALLNMFYKQSNNIFNEKWLQQIGEHTKEILKDTESDIVMVFKNVIAKTSKNSTVVKSINELNDSCVWKDQQIQHDFNYTVNGVRSEYAKFCKNVTSGIENRYAALSSAIGYMLHHHFDPTKGQAVILYDEAITNSHLPQGGTGKGLIVNGIKQIRMVTKIDGKNFNITNRFKFELVKPSTQVVWFDETNKDFKFDVLFSQLTDGWTIERKYLPQFIIQIDESPKSIICSNLILSNAGSSNKRRQFPVELNNYYSGNIINGTETPIQDEHGVLFDANCTSEEWDLFFSFMCDCSRYYLENGLISYERKNISLNLLKQQTCDDFVDWIQEQNFKKGIKYFPDELFTNFKNCYSFEKLERRLFANWIKNFASSKSWNVEFKSSNNKSYFYFSKIE